MSVMKLDFKHKLIINHSMVHEVLSCISCLIDEDHHLGVIDIEPFRILEKDHQRVLAFLKINPVFQMVFMEYALIIEERDDVKTYFQTIEELDRVTQIKCFLGFLYEEDEVKEALDDVGKMETCLKDMGVAEIAMTMKVIDDFEAFVQDFKKLALAVESSEMFKRALNGVKDQAVGDSIKEMEGEMANRHPLSYAQELMGKNFWNISDFEVYEFIPVYFLSPRTVRFMNAKRQIFMKPLKKKEADQDALNREIAETLKILSDPNRLKILNMTYLNPMYGKEIAEVLNITTATVSHHLDLMRNKGLLNVERNKNIKYFSTNNRAFTKLLKLLDEYVKR